MKTYNKKWISLAVVTMIASSTLGIIYDAKASPLRSGNSLSKNTATAIEPIKDTIYTGQNNAPDNGYTVKPGDTLPLIAQTNNVLAADIKLLNHLTSDSIHEGQIITIPIQKGTYATHTVIEGDSLDGIASDYAISVSDLKAYNNLTYDSLFAGQVLNLTGPIAASPPVETPAAENEAATEPPKPSEPKKTPTPTTNSVKPKASAGSVTTTQASSLLVADGQFPLKKGTYSAFSDTWGDSRKFGGDRAHEGTDIVAPIGTPVYSAADGTVIRYGWNDLGGWRLTVKTKTGISFYYAHMSKYADGIRNGAAIKKGQVIGYVGNTGYGPEGTSGQFDAHLHFGMYDSNMDAMNPYSHLKYWEKSAK